MLHLTRQGRFCEDYLTFKDGLSSFFSFVNFELHEIVKEGIRLALDVLNKITSDQPDRLIKDFKYHDCFGSYNVQIFSKGLPVDILETMIAPDRLLSNLSGSRQIMKNASRYLKGFALSNRVYMKYGWRLQMLTHLTMRKLCQIEKCMPEMILRRFAVSFLKSVSHPENMNTKHT